MNKKIFKYYDTVKEFIINNPKKIRNNSKDFTKLDVDFIRKFASKDKILLDIGSGTGLTINHLVNDFKKIIAIEKYKEFSQFIDKNIEIHNLDILEDKLEFNNIDIVTAFGVMNYFNFKEAILVYKKIFNILSSNGELIVKNQFGVKADIIIDGYSNELKTYYYSEYRFIDKEIKLLKEIGFFIEEIIDIYPQEYNRWENTHFYAIVCKKK